MSKERPLYLFVWPEWKMHFSPATTAVPIGFRHDVQVTSRLRTGAVRCLLQIHTRYKLTGGIGASHDPAWSVCLSGFCDFWYFSRQVRQMCSHTYTHHTFCDCVALHTHQCHRCDNALFVMFCEDYVVARLTKEGGCPNHRWKTSKQDTGGGKDGKSDVSAGRRPSKQEEEEGRN
jgi:hypothetical protein